MTKISPEAKAAAKEYLGPQPPSNGTLNAIKCGNYHKELRRLAPIIQDAIDASKPSSIPPLPTEIGWSKNREIVSRRLEASDNLSGAAWILSLYYCSKAGALGNPSLHHKSITQWLALHWGNNLQRREAFIQFLDAVDSPAFTPELAQAVVWKTILSSDHLGNWNTAQNSRDKPEKDYQEF